MAFWRIFLRSPPMAQGVPNPPGCLKEAWWRDKNETQNPVLPPPKRGRKSLRGRRPHMCYMFHVCQVGTPKQCATLEGDECESIHKDAKCVK